MTPSRKVEQFAMTPSFAVGDRIAPAGAPRSMPAVGRIARVAATRATPEADHIQRNPM